MAPKTLKDFFNAKPAAKQTPKRKTVIVDDEDEPPVKVLKKTEAEPQVGKAIDQSAYFSKARKSLNEPKPKDEPKQEQEVIDIDMDEDPVDLTEELKSPPRAKAATKAAAKADKRKREETPDFEPELIEESPVKAPAKSPAKTRAKKATKSESFTDKAPAKATPKASLGAVDGSSAEDVLSAIPDAVLPEIDSSGGGFNFFAAKAKAEAANETNISLPAARENCFAGLTFVFTGILPNVGRDQAAAFIKDHGGKVTTAPSKKTSVVVIGDDAGPKKIEKIKDLGIKVIDEDGFLQLIREMPADGGSGEEAQKAVEKQREQQAKAEQLSRELAASLSKEAGAKPVKTENKTTQSTKKPIADTSLLWTSKYAPKSLNDIVGNMTQVQRLSRWLRNWRENCNKGFKPGNGDGSEFRAVLIHGAPGIGKTTTAHLVAKLEGYDVVENNASDTRSKGLLESEVSKTLKNTSLSGFMHRSKDFDASKDSLKPLCVIMDEVDGMSGGDRGGVGAMAALARSTKVPLILIANDKSLPKMRPFDRVTYDMPFRRPDASAIRNRITAIAMAEGVNLGPAAVDQLVQATRSDIRQILNLISTYATTNKNMSSDDGAKIGKAWEKEIVLKPFDIVGRYLSGGLWNPNNGQTLNDKMELYFNDYQFAPLMVQENYLNATSRLSGSVKGGALAMAAEAAESISDGDLVDRLIHGSQQQWSLMPLHAVLSCVRPSYFIAGQASGRFNFSAWLGNNSKSNKYKRLLAEVQSHMRLKLWTAAHELRLDYHPLLADLLLEPFLSKGQEGIEEAIEFMDAYFLTKEDFDVIMELGVGPKSSEKRAKGIPTAVKSAFTRKYNSMDHPLPFLKFVDTKTVTRKAPLPDIDDVIEDDMEAEPEPETEETLDTQLEKDKYITRTKAKPKAKAKAKPKAKAKK